MDTPLLDLIPLSIIFWLAAAGLGWSLLYTGLHHQSPPYPPGPSGECIFGNALQIPAERQWVTFAQWTERYGGYIFLRIFRTPYLVINSLRTATDLLEQRSNIYSDRPVSTVTNES